jgi:hypothetical protein
MVIPPCFVTANLNTFEKGGGGHFSSTEGIEIHDANEPSMVKEGGTAQGVKQPGFRPA